MKLRAIELREVKMRLLRPFETSFGREREKDFLVVSVTDGELTGWGECTASAEPLYSEETTATAAIILKDHLIPRLWGEIAEPAEVRRLLAPIRRNPMAKAAVECAIWDLEAKRRGMSLAHLLGGVREKVPVGISLGIEADRSLLLDEIDRRLGEGYARIKVKIRPGWDRDVVAAIRERFGDIPLMVDANSCYTLADMPMWKDLDAFGLTMIEQPLAHDDIIDHATLQKALGTPICLDESIHSAEDARKAIAIGACRVINVKIGRLGGLEESRLLVDRCREAGIGVWCGGMLEAGIGRATNLAITSLEGFAYPGDTAATSRYWDEDITEPPVVMGEGGLIDVPAGPGIGVQVLADRLAKRTVAMERFTPR